MIRLALSLCLALLSLPATAQSGMSEMRLLPGWRMENGHHMAAIEIRLAPGWKTYWRAPGEAGIPPRFDWSASSNLSNVTVHWPAPHAFHQAGMRSIGYKDGVILPVEISPARPGDPVDLRLTLDYGVCREICVPVSEARNAMLAPDALRPDARIGTALAARPLTAGEASATLPDCRLAATANGAELTLTLTLPSLGSPEEMVIEPGGTGAWVSEPRLTRSGDTLTARARTDAPMGLDRANLRTTVMGRNGAVEIVGCS